MRLYRVGPFGLNAALDRKLIFKLRVRPGPLAVFGRFCPELLALTGDVTNVWFLNFLTCRDALPKLAKLQQRSVLAIAAIGQKYAGQIQVWQRSACFAPDVDIVSEMILQDARRIQALGTNIKTLDRHIKATAADSALAQTLRSIPGFGDTTTAELAGEIGTLDRFESEAGLALYRAWLHSTTVQANAPGRVPQDR